MFGTGNLTGGRTTMGSHKGCNKSTGLKEGTLKNVVRKKLQTIDVNVQEELHMYNDMVFFRVYLEVNYWHKWPNKRHYVCFWPYLKDHHMYKFAIRLVCTQYCLE